MNKIIRDIVVMGKKAAPWYQAGGAPKPVGVYQAVNADSIETSYINLANPGVNDITTTAAPAFDPSIGWTFDGVAQFLKTGIVPAGGYSVIIRYSNYQVTPNYHFIFGSWMSGARVSEIGNLAGSGAVKYNNGGGLTDGASTFGSSGVLAVAGQIGYTAGASDAVNIPAWSGISTQDYYIGALNNNGSAAYFAPCNIQAVAIYNAVLTPAQVLAITNSMNALEYVFSPAAVVPVVNASSPLTTPTYDESGQAMHPGLVYVDAGWNGYKYWMCMTPLTGNNATVENPSVLASNDGDTWVVPDGLTNPVVAAVTSPDFNSDPDLLMSADGSTLYLYYRTTYESTDPDVSKCFVKSSTDGVTWSEATELFSTAKNLFSSPAVIYDGSQYVMWSVEPLASPRHIYRRTCATPDGIWSAAIKCWAINQPNVSLYDLWHIDVNLVGGVYQMFMMTCDKTTSGSNGRLYFAQSNDGINWTFDDNPILIPGISGAWDSDRIYRASGLPITGGYDLFYSAASYINSVYAWHTGRVTLLVT